MAPFLQRYFHFKNFQLKPQTFYDSSEAVGLVTGFLMILVSLLGIFWPNYLGLNLSLMHCFVLGISGIISVFANFSQSSQVSSVVNFCLGIFFLLNALIGALVGEPGEARFKFYSEEQLRNIAPGFLELAVTDHIVHAAIGIVFLLESFSWKYHYMRKPLLKPKAKKYLIRSVGLILFLSLIIGFNYFISRAP